MDVLHRFTQEDLIDFLGMRRDLFEPMPDGKFWFSRVAYAVELLLEHIAKIVSDLIDRFDLRMNHPMELLDIMLEGAIDKIEKEELRNA